MIRAIHFFISELQVDRGAKVVDEGGEGGEIGAQRLQQTGTGYHRIIEGTQGDEILAPQVIGELEVRREAARHPYQHLAAIEFEAAAQALAVGGGLPAGRVVEDEVPHAPHGVRTRVPQPGADEAVATLQVQIERWRLDLAATRMEYARSLPRFVGRLVVGEAGVAVD